MRMILTMLVLALGTGLMFTGCKKKGSLRKTKGGMPYTYFGGDGKETLKKEGFVKFHVMQKLNDSVIFDSRKNLMPIYQQSNGMSQPYDISELFLLDLKKGDSIVATQSLDSFIKKNPALAERYKPTDNVRTYLKVIDVFNSMEAYKADEKAEKDKVLVGELKAVEDYVAKNKVEAKKTGQGTYVQLVAPGAGAVIDSGKFVSVKYTGTTFGGVKFDSNVDSTGKVLQPLSFVVGQGQMITGFDEGVKGLSKGSKAVLYIPSMLAYGPQPPTPMIKPFEHLKFEIEILDVQDKAPAPKADAMAPPPPPPPPPPAEPKK